MLLEGTHNNSHTQFCLLCLSLPTQQNLVLVRHMLSGVETTQEYGIQDYFTLPVFMPRKLVPRRLFYQVQFLPNPKSYQQLLSSSRKLTLLVPRPEGPFPLIPVPPSWTFLNGMFFYSSRCSFCISLCTNLLFFIVDLHTFY